MQSQQGLRKTSFRQWSILEAVVRSTERTKMAKSAAKSFVRFSLILLLLPTESSTLSSQLEDDINHVMSCRSVTGLAVTIVQSGQVVMSDGFGHAHVDLDFSDRSNDSTAASSTERHGTRCTENTKFVIASLSKAFTATLIGILLSENESRFPARWDTRVVEVMGPDFRFSDTLRTEHTSIRDLLAHRTGLPGYKMALMAGLDPRRARIDYCSSMRYMEFNERAVTTSFRNQFDYSNLMYLMAGCVAERLAGGEPLESLMYSKLFKPLSMNDTHLISQMELNDTRMATMYLLNEQTGQLEQLDRFIVQTVMPLDAAGGIITTANDMSKWLKFQLNEGRTDGGRRLLPAQYWIQTHSPQVSLSGSQYFEVRRPWFPVEDTFVSYGFGWRLGFYREYFKSEHSGRLSAFESKISLIPEAQLGVFTVSNGPVYHGKDFHTVLHNVIIDHFLNVTPWLNKTTMCTYPEPWHSQVVPWIRLRSGLAFHPTVVRPTTTHRPLDSNWLQSFHRMYSGVYRHGLLGFFNVTFRPAVTAGATRDAQDELTFKSGTIGEGRLIRVTATAWRIVFDGPLSYFGKTGPFRDLPLPVEFCELSHEPTYGERYQALKVIPYEPMAPPIYRRVTNGAAALSAWYLEVTVALVFAVIRL